MQTLPWLLKPPVIIVVLPGRTMSRFSESLREVPWYLTGIGSTNRFERGGRSAAYFEYNKRLTYIYNIESEDIHSSVSI